jgi:AcrR family transcriptional regulator
VGRKAGLTKGDVVAAAARIADRDGLELLTIAHVAEALGVQPPSLYHHVGGLEDLRHEVGVLGAQELARRFTQALADAPDLDGLASLRVMAHAFRDFARDHPGLYAAAQPATSLDADLTLYQAAPQAFDTVLATVASLGLTPDDQVHVIRSVRAALHGFILYESRPGFGEPDDVDRSFEQMIDLLEGGIRSLLPE